MSDSTKRFRVAFSFAGEKRDFVRQVADLLAAKFGEEKILYDKYHEAEFARNDLGVYLPDLYNLDSNMVVVVICRIYDKKEWTGLEWLAIHDLLQQRKRAEVMLCRFDRAQVKGLYRGAGFVELDKITPTDFSKLILERLAINEGRSKDFYSRPGNSPEPRQPHTTIPHNLPRLQPFFGREAELQKIAEALDPDKRTWGALIDGPGGMGKTSLAVRAAYDAPPDAFDRIVFVTLKSREMDDDGLRDLSGFLISGGVELFNELARELGHDTITKAVEDQRPKLLIEALRGTRTLLVLDNLESLLKRDRDKVFTFVQRLPPGCKAILTSRGRIGSGADELILGQLDETAALATLEELAKHNPDLSKTTIADRLLLYHQTGGKPLLLRWTAGQLGRGHCKTITQAINYLRSCPEGNDPLEFIFGDLVADFTESETKLLCALTYFTLPARIEHLADLAECKAEDAERALRTLANRSLVVPNDELTTFMLVPLVADFLHKKKPEVVTDTGSRLEKHVYALAIENGYANHDRFPLLDAAWPMVAAALPQLLAGPNDRLQTVYDALRVFLNFSGRWDERLALSMEAERKATGANDLHEAGWRAHDAGWVHFLRGQAAAVLQCADRAETHWKTSGPRERAAAIRLRGFGHQLAADYPAAKIAFEEAVRLLRSIEAESVDVASSLNSLAGVKKSLKDFESAERDYREALRIAKVVDYREGIANYTGNLADLVLDREQWPEAEALAREALTLSEKIGRQELVAYYSFCLAQALAKQGKQKEGLPYAQRAVEIFQRLGSPNLESAKYTLKLCQE